MSCEKAIIIWVSCGNWEAKNKESQHTNWELPIVNKFEYQRKVSRYEHIFYILVRIEFLLHLKQDRQLSETRFTKHC